VPLVAGLWPVLLLGIYAVNKRKDQVADQEKKEAMARVLARAQEEAKNALDKALAKADAEMKKAIEREVKKALEDAAKAPAEEGE
jgi:formate dehydrogenase iron-sulfur subunit